MGVSTVAIPVAGLTAPASWGSRESIKNMLAKIYKDYGSYFKFASENSKIPIQMLIAFCAVESGGKPTAGASGAVTQGLMQWNRTYAKKQLEDDYKKDANGNRRMSDAEIKKLASFGIKFDANGKTREITNADQLKPELNILIGSIVLGQLVDTPWGTEKKMVNGKEENIIRLDRVISVYNAGSYGDTGKKARLGNYDSALALANVVNPTTRSYIQKIMGKNGALDIATSDLKSVIV